jgi:hypothetical protein
MLAHIDPDLRRTTYPQARASFTRSLGAILLPMKSPDKQTALTGAFLKRFGNGTISCHHQPDRERAGT